MPSKKVVVLMKAYLGDAVMATPLLQELVDAGLDVHALTDQPVVDLLKDTFPKVRFFVTRAIQRPSQLLAQASELRARHYDLALVVNRSFRAALVVKMAKTPVRVGHNTDHRGMLLTKSEPYSAFRFEADCYLDLARLAGIKVGERRPFLAASDDSLKCAAQKLNGATIGIQPGARHPEKEIPFPALVEVVEALQQDRDVVLLGGPEEKPAGARLAEALKKKPLDLIGELSLRESIAATSQLKLMIGGDTGLMHIAAAADCPTVTLFGPTGATKWGHHYEPHQVLAAESKSMDEFTADDILSAARRALST